ncbi:MAG: aspartate aminotransferase family protein [Lentisphaeria bacterium]|nr:aspartate aminotransferase family protein [Lentisphaerota bacterium]MBR7145319.1 aspartate aminotransferase family protein [Lentisphaeria bacterium]
MNWNGSEKSFELFKNYVLQTYPTPGQYFVRGKGAYLYDEKDVEYLDFASGISVCNLGHAHPAIAKAVADQAATLVHISNLYLNDVTPRLAEKLISKCFDGAVFFANSGAEANEGLIKFARKFGNATGRNHIISMDNSFHGRTLATLAATGRAKYRKGFEPDMPGFSQVPYNDIEALKGAITDQTCAILLEPVQGEGGILPADPGYLKQVRQLCDEKNLLLLFDEVQCGMGRIGTLYAWQSFGVEPDAFSMAKALANGLPMGAFVVKRKYANILLPGEHASTFGGTPLVSAAALAVQEVFEKEDILANVNSQGEYLMRQLGKIISQYKFCKAVRGKGLMLGVVLDRPAGALSAAILKHKLITLTAGETVLRLLPPLNITRAEADLALERIAAGLADYAKTIEE